jgi:hypothetical protein
MPTLDYRLSICTLHSSMPTAMATLDYRYATPDMPTACQQHGLSYRAPLTNFHFFCDHPMRTEKYVNKQTTTRLWVA